MAQLLIRAAMNDHLVVNDLVVPSIRPLPAGRRRVLSHIVADAHVAAARPSLADTARGAAVPYVVDPDTTLMQSEVATTDRWTKLPYAIARAVAAGEVDSDELAAQIVEFQLEHGATVVMPGYFYASSPDDPWFELSLVMMEATADYMRDNNVRLPIAPVFCGQLQAFSDPSRWSIGIDRYLNVARDVDSRWVALCMSPAGDPTDGYGKVSRLFNTALHAKESGLELMAWRQGVYGLGLVAAGLNGYECGIGSGEQTQVSRRQSSRKPKPASDRGGGGGGIYLETVGRSVPRKVGQALLADLRTRAKVMCDDESCCPTVSATLDQPKHHAIRARARQMAEIDEQPHASWRLIHVARQAEGAVTLSAQANAVLKQERLSTEIKTRAMAALAQVASELASLRNPRRSA
jgi:hypothetical protein